MDDRTTEGSEPISRRTYEVTKASQRPRVSGDEHPSGLRDAIARRLDFNDEEIDQITAAVVDALSVVSEDERDSVFDAIYHHDVATDRDITAVGAVSLADAALAASRGVLLDTDRESP